MAATTLTMETGNPRALLEVGDVAWVTFGSLAVGITCLHLSRSRSIPWGGEQDCARRLCPSDLAYISELWF